MANRDSHMFEFEADKIAKAADAEAVYHNNRLVVWKERAEAAIKIVEQTIGAKVIERPVTGGIQHDVVVDYGDPEAWKEYQLATNKIHTHQEAADRYTTDARLYGTQGTRIYKLDT